MFIVTPGSRLAGMELREVDLRRRSGAVVVGVVRDLSVLYNPAPELKLAEADQIVLMGARAQLQSADAVLGEIQRGEKLPAVSERVPPVVG